MPSIGMVTALAVGRQLDRAMQETFDAKTKEDAYRFLKLSHKGGNVRTQLIAIWGTLSIGLAAVAGHAANALFLYGAVVTHIVLLLCAWALHRRNNARKALRDLIASDPEYWMPVQHKLEKIVLSAGKFDNGFCERQVTRIVR